MYQFIYDDKALGGDLYTHLRVVSKPYRKRYGVYDRPGRIKNRIDIEHRLTIESMRHLKNKVKTIALDNGLEFSAHEKIAEGLKTDIYFAHPYASWERGINENTNGLIRQYFPKRIDFSNVTDKEIMFVMNRLNNRPRATRDGRTPNVLFMGQREDLFAA